MLPHLEENYISVVIVTRNDEAVCAQAISGISDFLAGTFKNYEILVVDNCSSDRTIEILRDTPGAFTVVEFPRTYPQQAALTAGVDLAVGDYIVEIPDLNVPFPPEAILKLYHECQKGHDFVFYTPASIPPMSRLFYMLINRQFHNRLPLSIASSVMTMSSRRGQNRVTSLQNRQVNRTVSYAMSGLKSSRIDFNSAYRNKRGLGENIFLLLDTFIYHTEFLQKILTIITTLFFLFCIGCIGYGGYSYIFRPYVSGWLSSFIFMTVAFSGVFLVFLVIARQLNNLMRDAIQTRPYTFTSVTKKER